ncbi:MAG: AbrB/MazE/SpoVT family DNA-binding domain-containing protein [Armatimonadetes bacterium]|nr:AbrB/MazE/SpoVT family DNA-binding domain-containing protein [Armatimonadota bacterium]
MKISERGQITIPKKLRGKYGLQKDVEIEFVPEEKGVLLRKRVLGRHPLEAVFGILHKKSRTDEYIEDVRGR